MTQAPPPAPGPYFPLSATQTAEVPSFRSGDKFAAVYYFYWYKWKDSCAGPVCDPTYTRGHIEFATGAVGNAKPVSALTNSPKDIERMDFSDPAWHRSQIQLILSASIEVVLPVFWGVPGRYDEDGHHVANWSKRGLEALSTALEELESDGEKTPRVGMFYDTSTLTFESPYNYRQGNRVDLRTEAGKNHFYATIRDFYSLVPPRFWACWEARPLVWLYSSSFADGYDESLLSDTRVLFSDDFGGLEPWFVAHVDWEGLTPDWVYKWGGAIRPSFLSVNAIGPGFDNSGALGKPRGSHMTRGRDDGRHYRGAWEHALRTTAPITVIETWNELHEGTEICPTREHGDEYLNITGRYASRFLNERDVPPLPGPYRDEESAFWSAMDGARGVSPVEVSDGGYRRLESEHEIILEMAESYLYFEVDDSYYFAEKAPLRLEIEVYDLPKKFGSLAVQYDSYDRSGTLHGIYKNTEARPLSGSFLWKKHVFEVPDARLANNQNEGADFRILGPRGLRVRDVRLSRVVSQ